MAGFYPDVPGNRFAYHNDGTKLYIKDASNNLTDITTGAAAMNDESTTSYNITFGAALLVMFPEPRTVLGYFVADQYDAGNQIWPGALRTSTDTTTGLDGTWSTVANPWTQTNNENGLPDYRTKINTGTFTAIKAIEFDYGFKGAPRIDFLHLYGTIPTTSNPDRLIFWEPVNNNATTDAFFDWGDVPLSTTHTKQFRIKNNSATKTANSITLSCAAPSPDMALTFSTDNVTFTSTLNIGNLAAGITSSVIYVQRTIPSNEALTAHACYMKASAASWV